MDRTLLVNREDKVITVQIMATRNMKSMSKKQELLTTKMPEWSEKGNNSAEVTHNMRKNGMKR